MRFVVVALIGMLGLVSMSACGPTSHRHDDQWGETATMEPEISGNNAKDEDRWRRQLASDPWGDDARLLTDDSPLTAADYEALHDDTPPLDFVGPPAPPSRWDTMQSGSPKFGKIFFSIMTVLVTLGMMAAPYLLMI
jgi:hypothetical protein